MIYFTLYDLIYIGQFLDGYPNWRMEMDMHIERIADSAGRRSFIGGSDARVIMGDDEAALLRLWREHRGEVAPPMTYPPTSFSNLA